MEYNGADHHLNLKFINGQQISASYFQSITPSLAIGCESLYDIPHAAAIWNGGAKYSKQDWTGVVMIANQGTVSYSPALVLLLLCCNVSLITCLPFPFAGLVVPVRQTCQPRTDVVSS